MLVRIVFLIAMGTVSGITTAAVDAHPPYVPKDGFVPSAEVAVKIAEAVLIPVFGEQQVLAERPFKATLEGEVWIVEGTLNCAGRASHCVGGTAEVRISRKSGEILRLIHYE